MANPPPNLNDRNEYPAMVGWFDPPMLVDIARQAIVSALFGQYADRRLIQAALDPANSAEFMRRAELTASIPVDPQGAVWVDYVADLGDGFDSTYAIAHLLGKERIDIEGQSLPRGQMLVMGGDQVYPAATRTDYRRRMRRPYEYAFPDSSQPDAAHPALVLIPGNHDWYDGLTLFLALFCTNREKKIGSWRAIQRRSYFAQRLPHDWWVWAFDSQLGEDIDQPQADYFVSVAKAMPEDAKIILFAPVPTWIYGELKAKNAEEREKFYRGLDYVALEILSKNCKNARVCAVISGDTHHYSRYSAKEDGTQFITAGGGGAFLHPTHQLIDEIDLTWMGKLYHLSLKTDPGPDHQPIAGEACYPKRVESKALLKGNKKFAISNWLFSLTLGGIYWVAAQLLLLGRDDLLFQQAPNFWVWSLEIARAVGASPMFVLVALGLIAVLHQYADAKTKASKAALGILHAIPHVVLLLVLVSILPPLNVIIFGLRPGGIPYFFAYLLEVVIAGGFAGGVIWGAYLTTACKRALHWNDAFSAMRLDSYRHFLRLRLTKDELTIYSIGLDKAPRREDWQINPNGRNNQNEPVVVPKSKLQPRLIEKPIIIRAR